MSGKALYLGERTYTDIRLTCAVNSCAGGETLPELFGCERLGWHHGWPWALPRDWHKSALWPVAWQRPRSWTHWALGPTGLDAHLLPGSELSAGAASVRGYNRCSHCQSLASVHSHS